MSDTNCGEEDFVNRLNAHPDELVSMKFTEYLAMDTKIKLLTQQREELIQALRDVQTMTNEDAGTFRKRGGTYRGLVSVIVDAALAKLEKP